MTADRQPRFADDWEVLAEDRLRSATHLLQIRQLADAYSIAGVAIECALKARVMRSEGMNMWPERSRRPDLYVHDLPSLLRLGGLEAAIIGEMTRGTDLATAWMIAKEWRVDSRYVLDMRPKLVRDMLWSVRHDGAGLIRWISKR